MGVGTLQYPDRNVAAQLRIMSSDIRNAHLAIEHVMYAGCQSGSFTDFDANLFALEIQ